jgi:CheY-like chemotaxis protein
LANILIVDDAVYSSLPLARFLGQLGHGVKCLTNGKDAVATLITDTPDLVIVDGLPPEMGGPSFLEVMRSYVRLKSLPVIVLTGVADSPVLGRAWDARVNTVLRKDEATFEDIGRAVREALHGPPSGGGQTL